MDLAGEIVQDMCAYLGVAELASEADFPLEIEAFTEVLAQVDDYNLRRLELTANMADSSNAIKTLVIKARTRGCCTCR